MMASAKAETQPKAMTMYTNPRYTNVLLDILNLTPVEFQAIHHHGPKADLQSHRDYCRGTKRFQENGANVQTAIRLENELLARLRKIAGEG
jgi:hypothetical protein